MTTKLSWIPLPSSRLSANGLWASEASLDLITRQWVLLQQVHFAWERSEDVVFERNWANQVDLVFFFPDWDWDSNLGKFKLVLDLSFTMRTSDVDVMMNLRVGSSGDGIAHQGVDPLTNSHEWEFVLDAAPKGKTTFPIEAKVPVSGQGWFSHNRGFHLDSWSVYVEV